MTNPRNITEAFLDSLAAIVGDDGMRAGDAVALVDPGVDDRNLGARLMARPADSGQVARVLALCAHHGIGVVPQGGRTGLSGGAVSTHGDLILSLDRLCAVEDVDPASRTATVQAGLTLQRLDELLAPHRLCAGIDLGARGSATIGGMVATNAGGIDAFRRGTMRERVLGLEVALSTGELYTDLSRVRKDNAGLALRQLFIGSEGTLGVITRVVLALVPVDGQRHAALALFRGLDEAVGLMRTIETGERSALVAAEVMSGNHIALTARSLGIAPLIDVPAEAFGLLIAVAGRDAAAARDELEHTLANASEAGELLDCVLPKNASEERDLWRVREDWAVDRARPGGLWYDVSVPVARLGGYLTDLEARLARCDPTLAIFVVGHLADGNIHVTVNAERPLTGRYDEIALLVYAGLREMGGSFSAEHGIGLEKRLSLEHWAGPGPMRLMGAVKDIFDPAGIMNPGKVLRRNCA